MNVKGMFWAGRVGRSNLEQTIEIDTLFPRLQSKEN